MILMRLVVPVIIVHLMHLLKDMFGLVLHQQPLVVEVIGVSKKVGILVLNVSHLLVIFIIKEFIAVSILITYNFALRLSNSRQHIGMPLWLSAILRLN